MTNYAVYSFFPATIVICPLENTSICNCIRIFLLNRIRKNYAVTVGLWERSRSLPQPHPTPKLKTNFRGLHWNFSLESVELILVNCYCYYLEFNKYITIVQHSRYIYKAVAIVKVCFFLFVFAHKLDYSWPLCPMIRSWHVISSIFSPFQ